MTGLISVSVNTRSPCAAVPLTPSDLNAAQLPRAKPAFTFTAPTVTLRSVRGNATRYTSPGIAVPDLPIALSMAAVSRPAGFGVGVCAKRVEIRTNVEIMLRITSTLKIKLKT